MKKHKIAIILGLCLLVTLAHVYKLKTVEHEPKSTERSYIIDGDVIPGIGASITKPDTVLVYSVYGEDTCHMRYFHNPLIKDTVFFGGAMSSN